MKTGLHHLVLFSVFLGIFINPVFSKCSSGSMWVWPEKGTIPVQPVIMLNTYAMARNYVSRESWSRSEIRIYLISSQKKKILLNLFDVVNASDETQLLFVAAKPLIPGEQYNLVVEGLPDEMQEKADQWLDKEKYKDQPRWTVASQPDATPPVWKSKPQFDRDEVMQLGCGPAEWLIFTSKIEDQSNCLVKVTMTGRETGTAQTVYAVMDASGEFRIGHSMCGGMIHFGHNSYFDLHFQLLDQQGNYCSEEATLQKIERPREREN